MIDRQVYGKSVAVDGLFSVYRGLGNYMFHIFSFAMNRFPTECT